MQSRHFIYLEINIFDRQLFTKCQCNTCCSLLASVCQCSKHVCIANVMTIIHKICMQYSIIERISAKDDYQRKNQRDKIRLPKCVTIVFVFILHLSKITQTYPHKSSLRQQSWSMEIFRLLQTSEINTNIPKILFLSFVVELLNYASHTTYYLLTQVKNFLLNRKDTHLFSRLIRCGINKLRMIFYVNV